MKKIRSILLIVDPELSSSAACHRAIALATALRAELTLALINPGPKLAVRGNLDAVQIQQAEFLMRDQQSAHLQLMASQIRNRHPNIAVRAFDDRRKLSAALLMDVVVREGFDLVIKDFGNDSALRSLMLSELDRQLLNQSPVPVWLVSTTSQRPPRRFGIAVDLSADGQRRSEANDAAVETTQTLASACGGLLRVFSSTDPGARNTDRLDDEVAARRRMFAQRQVLSQLLLRHELSTQAGEIVDGASDDQFAATLAGFRPDVLVLGLPRSSETGTTALARSTEKLIEEFPGDLMTVPAIQSMPVAASRPASTRATWAM